jgi:hypothetical protein
MQDSCHMHRVPRCEILKFSFNKDCQQQSKVCPSHAVIFNKTPPFLYLLQTETTGFVSPDTKMLFNVLCDSHLRRDVTWIHI